MENRKERKKRKEGRIPKNKEYQVTKNVKS
jgi:hypothetical protein